MRSLPGFVVPVLLVAVLGCGHAGHRHSSIAVEPMPAPTASAAAPSATPEAAAAATPAAPAPLLYDDLGHHRRPVSTKSALAQKCFDQALTLTFAFNHDEAIRLYEEAARQDPACAMPH